MDTVIIKKKRGSTSTSVCCICACMHFVGNGGYVHLNLGSWYSLITDLLFFVNQKPVCRGGPCIVLLLLLLLLVLLPYALTWAGPKLGSWRVFHYINNFGFSDLKLASPSERCRMATCIWEFYKTRDDFMPMERHYMELLTLFDTYNHDFDVSALEQELTPHLSEWKQNAQTQPAAVHKIMTKSLWQKMAKAYAKAGDVKGAERTLDLARRIKYKMHRKYDGSNKILGDDELAASVTVLLNIAHGDLPEALSYLQKCAANQKDTTAEPFRQLMLKASRAGNAKMVLDTIIAMRDAGYDVTSEHGTILAKAYGVAGSASEMAKVLESYELGIKNIKLETDFFESCLTGRFEDAKGLLTQYTSGDAPMLSTVTTLFDAYLARADSKLAAGMLEMMFGHEQLRKLTFRRQVWHTALSTFTDAADGNSAARLVKMLLRSRECPADSELLTLGLEAVLAHAKQKAGRPQPESGGWREEATQCEKMVTTLNYVAKDVDKSMARSSQFTQAVLEWDTIKTAFTEKAEKDMDGRIANNKQQSNIWLLGNRVDGLLGSSSFELTCKLAGISAHFQRLPDAAVYPRNRLDAIKAEVDAGDHKLTFDLRVALIAAHLAADQQEEASALLHDFYDASDVHKANVDVLLPFVHDRLRRGGVESALAFLKGSTKGRKAMSQPRLYLPLLEDCMAAKDSANVHAVLELMRNEDCPLYENMLVMALRTCFASQSSSDGLAVAAEGQKRCGAFNLLNHCALLAESFQEGGESLMFELVPGFVDLGLDVPAEKIVEEIAMAVQKAESEMHVETFEAKVQEEYEKLAQSSESMAREASRLPHDKSRRTREHFWTVAFSNLLAEIKKSGKLSIATKDALIQAHKSKVLEFSSFITTVDNEMQVSNSLANAAAKAAMAHDQKTKRSISIGPDPMAPFRVGIVRPTSELVSVFNIALGQSSDTAHKSFQKELEALALKKGVVLKQRKEPSPLGYESLRYNVKRANSLERIKRVGSSIKEVESRLDDDQVLTLCAELGRKKYQISSEISKQLFERRLSKTVNINSSDPGILFKLLQYKIGQEGWTDELDAIFQKLKDVSKDEDQKFWAAQHVLLAYAKKGSVKQAKALYEMIVNDHAKIYQERFQLVEGNMIILFCNKLATCPVIKRGYWMNEYFTAMGRLTEGSDTLEKVSDNVIHAMITAHTSIGEYEAALTICKSVSDHMSYSMISHYERSLLSVADPPVAIDFLYRAMASRDVLYAASFLRAFKAVSDGPFDIATYDKFLNLANDDGIEIKGDSSLKKSTVLRVGKIYRLKLEVKSALKNGSTSDGGEVTPAWIASKIKDLFLEVRSQNLPNDEKEKKLFIEIAKMDQTGLAMSVAESL